MQPDSFDFACGLGCGMREPFGERLRQEKRGANRSHDHGTGGLGGEQDLWSGDGEEFAAEVELIRGGVAEMGRACLRDEAAAMPTHC